VPDNPAAQATKFSPERIQAVIGFVFTSTAANPAVGGFGLGDLAGGAGPLSFKIPGAIAVVPGTPASLPVLGAPPAAPGPALAGPASTAGAPRLARTRPKTIAALGPIGMGTATRLLLALVCVAAWGWLTHLGASRFRRATAPCPPSSGATE
jgi:hypothetical protein